MLAIYDELEEAFYLKNDVTYFYDYCTYDTEKKQLEKIIIDFRSSTVVEISPFANTLTNWKKEIINSFIIVDDKANRKMNPVIVENRNKSIKFLKHTSNDYFN
ncbi:transposase [Catenibacterium sp.]|uniref:transposase n=1 Tax=Catenibacterium sp. TaxID=2049022 RepID=UPI0040293C5F